MTLGVAATANGNVDQLKIMSIYVEMREKWKQMAATMHGRR